ncbi:MAG: phosphatase PAP2 family protein [Bradyrhizobium sp.]|nr:MAG: phosphatase PAP2 family protein [Bradyrhizobium sp.]
MGKAFWAICAAIVLVGVVFAVWPDLDLVVAHFFYDGGGFMGGEGWQRLLRECLGDLPFVVLAAYVVLYLLRRFGRAVPWAPDGRGIVFLILTLAIGPGLIVNLGFKDHWHRPRPSHIVDFGGGDPFRPWYLTDGACKRNCSFVSGEASTGFWMVAPALLAPPPLRSAAVAGALVFGVAASALRLAFGGHFLSDVLLGGLVALLVIVVTRRFLWPRGGP